MPIKPPMKRPSPVIKSLNKGWIRLMQFSHMAANMIKKITLLTSYFIFSSVLAQEEEPSVYSEIFDNYFTRNYYLIDEGDPETIKVNDTIFLVNSEKWIEENIFSFKNSNEIVAKKYKNDSLAKDEIYQLDSKRRIIRYEGNIKYSKGEWYKTKLVFTYEPNKKIIEKINSLGKIYMRYEVEYDSLKNPILIKDIIVGSNSTKIESVDYDYANEIFVHMEFNYDGKIVKEKEGFINLDYILEKNKYGDITRMYWVTANKQNNIIYDIEYDYDDVGNWTKMIKTINEGGEKEIYSKTHREIKYKN